MKSTLTGLTDTDKIILLGLSDKDLLNICQTDVYFSKICKNSTFWRERFISIFGPYAAKYKPENRSWRQHYLKVIRDINILNNGEVEEKEYVDIKSYNWRFIYILRIEPGEELPDVYNNFPYLEYMKKTKGLLLRQRNLYFYTFLRQAQQKGYIPLKKADEITMNIYWMSKLTEKENDSIDIRFILPWEQFSQKYSLDYFQSDEMWKYPKYFTPAKLNKIIQDFYNSKITEEEFKNLRQKGISVSGNETRLEICQKNFRVPQLRILYIDKSYIYKKGDAINAIIKILVTE